MRRGPINNHHISHRILRVAPFAAIALLVAGCSSSGIGGSDASLSQAMASATPNPDTTGSTGNLERCPNVELRQGAGTYAINTASRDPSATALRYQVSIGQTARECSSVGGNLVMRVGLQGRVVLGPAGGPGTLDIPIRYAVVEEGMQPKTIFTKLERIPVTVVEGQPHVAFTHIEENISVPMPPNAAFDNYVIYVGFDPMGASQEKKKPAPKRARQS